MKVPDMESPNAPMPGPVKHGWVQCAADWPQSSFHAFVRRRVYAANWGGGGVSDLQAGE